MTGMHRIKRMGLLAAFGVTAVVAGLAGAPAGADPVARNQKFDAALEYACAFPSASHQTAVTATATAPTVVGAGDPVSLTDVTIALSFPEAAAAELTALGAATVSVTTELSTTAGDEAALWSGSAPDTAVPPAGPLELISSVGAPDVIGGELGELVFTAGALGLTAQPMAADGTAGEAVAVQCTPVDPEQTRLGSVRVAEAGSVPSREPLPSDPSAGGALPGGASTQAAPEVPPDCARIPPPQPPGTHITPYCAYLLGFANVAKLDAASFQPAGIVNIAAEDFKLFCKPETGRPWLCQKATSEPRYNGGPQLPPAPATFLGFGFVPVKATMQLTQVGQINATVEGTLTQPYEGGTVAKGQLMARIFDATVNGVPLELGPNCWTATPIDVELRGPYPGYRITEGGVLDGTIAIPPFSGCGVNEDLDPILTGMVSGPGNYVRLTQGSICTFQPPFVRCPPPVPTPQ